MRRVTDILDCRRGATGLEYGLIAAVMALAVLGLYGGGDALSDIFARLAGPFD